MIPQTTELSQIQAAFIDKDKRIEELMRQINSAQSLLNSLKETTNSLVGDGKITIKTYAGSNVGDFTVNQKEDKTITLPQQATVNNGTLTIQKNGTTVGTFTANQSGNTTANITVPTKTSEITNDSDFVSDANYVHTDNNFTNADKAEIGKINNSLQFTYVVDSDQKLADWANNVSGNDYTSVLIKKGTYNCSSTIDIAATGTIKIAGEAGSIIHTTVRYGISGQNVTDWSDRSLVNVTVRSTFNLINSYCFYYCQNMTNCKAIHKANGFAYCKNMIHCFAQVGGQFSTREVKGFFYCENLIQCNGKVTNIGNAASVFQACNFLYQCDGEVASSSHYTYSNCFGVQFCKGTFNNSYFSPAANSTYACANTLNGGWNTTA